MPDNSTTNTDNGTQTPANGQQQQQQGQQQNTPDAAANNTAANPNGQGTQTQQKATEDSDKKFTQAELDRFLAERVKKGVRAELKKLSGESDEPANAETLQTQLNDANTELRTYRAQASVEAHLSDPANKLTIRPENRRAVEKLVLTELKFNDDGTPANIAEAVKAIQTIAPALFSNIALAPSINAGNGNQTPATGFDMNAMIRQAAGR